MSDYVHSSGYFGRLKKPIGNHTTKEWEDCQEKLEEHDMGLSYDGTMIFSNTQQEIYDVGLVFVPSGGAFEFRTKCLDLGHDVDPVKHYSCTWYNGSDSPMSDATVKEVFGE